MVVYSLWNQNRRRQRQIPYRSEDSIEAPDHPILGGVSLRDMIEMTTSGSGSGEILFSPWISLIYSEHMVITVRYT